MAKEEVKKTSKLENTKNEEKKTMSKKEVESVKNDSTSIKKETKIVQEENNYGKTLLAAILILVIFVGGYFVYQYKKGGTSNEQDYVATEDEKKFKDEYESLNGTTRSNGHLNKNVSIMDDNNIVYISLEQAAEIIDSGSGVIYFGFAACPWCRNAIPILLDAMNSTSLDKIYYVDVRPNDEAENDIRDTYTLNTKGKARKTKDASDAYYQVLLALANELDDYILTTDDGKEINTGEKRLFVPTVVAVLEGELVGFHQGTLEGHVKDANGDLPDLTKEEQVELLNSYTSLISNYLGNDCPTNSDGGC